MTTFARSLVTYPWFDQVPAHLKTRNQLAALGLRPGGAVQAQVVWRRGQRRADLFDVQAAKPKQVATPAQRAALARAQIARRTCPNCQTAFAHVLTDACPECDRRAVQADRVEATKKARRWLTSERTVILDTETTDLDGYLVQIAITTITGEVLLDTLVNPHFPISAEAYAVHGISAAEVADAPTFADLCDIILGLLREKRVITYNAAFDRSILYNELCRYAETQLEPHPVEPVALATAHLRASDWACAMHLYAQWVGEWSAKHERYRWHRLPGGDHSAVGDCRATIAVLQRVAASVTGEAGPPAEPPAAAPPAASVA